MTKRAMILASAIAASTATALIISGASTSHQQDHPVKIHMTELVIGATHGLQEIGWTNPTIEKHVAALEVRAEPHRNDALRATGRAQALEGRWGDAILVGYLSAIETPIDSITAQVNVVALKAEYQELRETHAPSATLRIMDARHRAGESLAFEERVARARIRDAHTWWDVAQQKMGTDASVPQIADQVIRQLGYAVDPIQADDIDPDLLKREGGSGFMDSRSARDVRRSVPIETGRRAIEINLMDTPDGVAL